MSQEVSLCLCPYEVKNIEMVSSRSLLLIIIKIITVDNFCFRSDLKSQLSLKQISKPHSFRGKLAKMTQAKFHKSEKKQQKGETRKKSPMNSKIRNKKGALIHFRAIESIIMKPDTRWQKQSTCVLLKVSKYVEG